MPHTIEIKDLSRKIGSKDILININLTLEGGKIYGLVGKNGSGKTMLIRSLAGLMRPTSGSISYNGKKLYEDIDYIPGIGIIIENIGLYPEFTGYDNLKYLADIRKKIGKDEIRAAIAKVGLDPDDKRTVRKYSLGMRQRIVIAQAIMESPDVLLLDEPTNALDESGIMLVRDICREAAARGSIVLIASHSKEDINALCDQKFTMHEGVLKSDSE